MRFHQTLIGETAFNAIALMASNKPNLVLIAFSAVVSSPRFLSSALR
jgi:hypothetical protein